MPLGSSPPEGQSLAARHSKSATTPHRGPARWPVALAFVLLATAIATLFWLRGRLVHEEDAALGDAVRVLAETRVLGTPEDDTVRFSQLESLARSLLERPGLLRSVVITKNLRGNPPLPVHPFHLGLTDPDWEKETVGWRRLAVPPGTSDPDGWLLVQPDTRSIDAVDRVVALLSIFLLAALGVLVFRQHGKEQELSRTTVELERRRGEILRLERLAMAGQLTASLLHDLKKPVLNIRHEAADCLESTGGGETAAQESMAAIREQTDLFLAMLRETGIERFVRSEGEDAEFCDLREALDRSLSLVQYERGNVAVHLLVEPGALGLVFAPPHRLVLLFSNLVLNAYQELKGEGSLWVEGRQQGDTATISLEDSGHGVPPDMRDSVFEPFFTTKGDVGGSGLGLFIVAGIARDMGGNIQLADPSRARGARFVVTLPTRKEGRISE